MEIKLKFRHSKKFKIILIVKSIIINLAKIFKILSKKKKTIKFITKVINKKKLKFMKIKYNI